jgi:nucleoside-diphosphate-sugar epimerase
MAFSVLITGGMGFIGSHLARALLKKGYSNIVLIDVIVSDKLVKDIKDRVTMVRCDVTDVWDLNDVFRTYKPQVVFHLASPLSAAMEANPRMGFRVAIEGTFNVYEMARVYESEMIIFTSSIAAYGTNVESRDNVIEDTYTVPYTLYGVSKQYGEMLGLWFHRKYGIEFAAFRLASVIGPGRANGGVSAYTALIISKAALGEEYVIYVSEDTAIPIVYVKDAADALITAYEKKNKLISRVYNIASLVRSPTAAELVNAVKKFIPDAKLIFKPDPKMTAIAKSWPRSISIERFKREVGWTPKYDNLELLIKDFIDEVRQNPEMYRV